MRWGKRGHAARGYHHGNLKEALVRAALELIAEKGPAGFTFADAARWAGVSPAAPYRHYRDRDALLADVARRGFELFAAALAQAWDDGSEAEVGGSARFLGPAGCAGEGAPGSRIQGGAGADLRTRVHGKGGWVGWQRRHSCPTLAA